METDLDGQDIKDQNDVHLEGIHVVFKQQCTKPD